MLRACSQLLLLAISAVAMPAQASSDFYAVAGIQYSRSGEPYDVSGPGYQVGGGYVINRQWSVELSAEQLFSDKRSSDFGPTRLKSDGVTLAVLGKTQLQDQLVLFYRAGFSQLDHQAEYPYVISKTTLPNGAIKTEIGYHRVDDTLLHGVLGLGLEQQFTAQWFGRAEVVHTFKKHELQADTFRLSLGYRF